MQVTVRLYGQAKRLLNTSELKVVLNEGSTLRALLGYIANRHGEEIGQFFDPASNSRFPMIILVDGKDHRLSGGMDTPLRDITEIVFIPPAVGG